MHYEQYLTAGAKQTGTLFGFFRYSSHYIMLYHTKYSTTNDVHVQLCCTATARSLASHTHTYIDTWGYGQVEEACVTITVRLNDDDRSVDTNRHRQEQVQRTKRSKLVAWLHGLTAR